MIEPLRKTTHNTLIELLLMNRIFFGDERISNDEIMSYITFAEKKVQELCGKILRTLDTLGINHYLCFEYQDSHCTTIDFIFNKVIMQNYTQKYINQVTLSHLSWSKIVNDTDVDNVDTYRAEVITDEVENKHNTDIDDIDDSDDSGDDGVFEFTQLLFNQTDLVPQIFQYLEFKDLNQCSLVSFIWLIHAYDINS